MSIYLTVDIQENLPLLAQVEYDQYDENFRDIIVTVLDGDKPFDLEPYSARILGTKADKNEIYHVCAVVSNVIFIDVTLQMTVIASPYTLDLMIINADSRKTLIKLNTKIRRASIQRADVVSVSEITAVDSLDKAAMLAVLEYVQATYDVSEWAAFKTAAETARDAAAGSAAAASNSATAAAGSALAASNSAGSASDSATEATEKAGEAAANAEQASNSASAAAGRAEAASDAKGVCEDKAREVSTNATAAAAAARYAADSESSARGSADTASKAANTATQKRDEVADISAAVTNLIQNNVTPGVLDFYIDADDGGLNIRYTETEGA